MLYVTYIGHVLTELAQRLIHYPLYTCCYRLFHGNVSISSSPFLFLPLPPCPSLSSWQPVIDYCNEKYDQYLRDESGLNRRNIEDHRVHCCLYFINPLGHG